MTTKTLTGTYSSGYKLSAAYSALDVAATAKIAYGYPGTGIPAGDGVELPFVADMDNAGSISAGTGSAGGYMGGAGVFAAARTSISNTGVIDGGSGGRGFLYAPKSSLSGGTGGSGVNLTAGGSLSNEGAIVGGIGGHGARDGSGGFGGMGIEVAAVGAVVNDGVITGGAGGYGGAFTGSEYPGTRGGDGGSGIELSGIGSVLNMGTIRGGRGAFWPKKIIQASDGVGIYLVDGGSVINGSGSLKTALIAGQYGVFAQTPGAATITNFGTIEGTSQTSVLFESSADRLIVEAGSDFIGVVRGGGGTLELPASGGTISGLGSSFTGFGNYVVDAGGDWTFAGANAVGANQTLTNFGTMVSAPALGATSARLIVETGSSIVGKVVGGGGTLELAAAGGTLSGLGAVGTISGGASVVFSDFGAFAVDAGTSWTLAGGKATLGAHESLSNFGTLAGALTLGSDVDRLTVGSGSKITGAVAGDHGTLELIGGGGTITGLGGAGSITGEVSLTFDKFADYIVDAGGAWALSGRNTLSGDQTLANFGTLTGALKLGFASDRLIAEAGSTITGAVAGGRGMLELAAPTGTIAGLGHTASISGAESMTFSGFGAYVIDAGGAWTLSGANTLGASQTLTNFGILDGGLLLASSKARLIVGAGSTITGTVAGGGGTLELAAATGTISGLGSTGVLTGGEAMTFSGFGAYVIDAGAAWAMTGANVLAASQSLTIAGTLTNLGSLTQASGIGVTVAAGGALVDGSTASGAAMISGLTGLYAGPVGSATVTNFGTIDGTSGTAVLFKSAADRLILGAGSKLVGVAVGGGGVLELAAGAGTIGGLGASFTGFGSYLVDAGGTWTLSGTNTLAAAGSLTNAGALSVTGSLADLGAVSNAAGGVITVANGATLEAQGVVANAGVIALASAGADTDLLILTPGATLSGGGTVSMSGGKSQIIGASASAMLTNLGATIAGSGSIGLGELTLDNGAGGVIEAAGGQLSIQTNHGQTLDNAGLIEAVTGGLLQLTSTTIDQTAGGILWAAGGNVDLVNCEVIGGSLASGAASALKVSSGSCVLDGVTQQVDLTGQLDVLAGATLTLRGNLADSGKLDLYGGEVVVGAAGVTLSGDGQVNLDNDATNTIAGASPAAVLTNVDVHISGAGSVGDGKMGLVNEAKGVIANSQSLALSIDTGGATIANAGTIEAIAAGGGVTVASALDNTGELLAAHGGTLTLDGAVTGNGAGRIDGGVLDASAAADFQQDVAFATGGTLDLADSRAYAGTISGYSTAGATALDLADIAYASATTTVTYAGTTGGGVLTVTDGTHTAHIHLTGDYLASTWKLASDGHGGTIVVDPPPASSVTFASAMAALGPRAGPAGVLPGRADTPPVLLAASR